MSEQQAKLMALVLSSFLRVETGGIDLKLGQWGYCLNGQCSGSKLGWNADDVVEAIASTGNVSGFFIKNLTFAQILNPIAAGVVLVAIIVSLTNNVILGKELQI